jgi:multicomponent Na+:H+ antiporter subunit E
MKDTNIFWLNIFLPLVWMAVTGSISLLNFAFGFALSSLCLWLIHTRSEVALVVYPTRILRFFGFLGFFAWELLLANLRVAWEVITPKHHMRPAIIAVPLDTRTDFQTTILANFITLTPGTLSLDVAPDRKTLYVHAMYVDDPDLFRRDIKERLERRVIEVFR